LQTSEFNEENTDLLVRNILMVDSYSFLFNEGNQRKIIELKRFQMLIEASLKSGIFKSWNRLPTIKTSVTSVENIEKNRFRLIIAPGW